jgi:hypothetical protein
VKTSVFPLNEIVLYPGNFSENSELSLVPPKINFAGHRNFHPLFMGGVTGMAASKTLQFNFRIVQGSSHIATSTTGTCINYFLFLLHSPPHFSVLQNLLDGERCIRGNLKPNSIKKLDLFLLISDIFLPILTGNF